MQTTRPDRFTTGRIADASAVTCGPATLLTTLLLGLAACTGAPPESGSPSGSDGRSSGDVAEAARTITAESMLERISFFGSDELRGRATPGEGLERAADHIVEEYRELGVEPAGEDGTYLQRYPFACPAADGPAAGGRCVLAGDDAVGENANVERSEPPNVVGVLPGSDPALRDEYVLLTAHFDHLGVGTPVAGDSIYNGADDNGSGTSALLEVARALTLLEERPRRSVLFLHVSGEEHGLLGSRWYSDHPTVDLDAVVGAINLDMIASDLHRDTVVIIGKEYSSLGPLVDEVNAGLDLGLVSSDDLWPEQRFFFRSDHFNFARKEIPSLFFFTGVHDCYHQPCDEPAFVDPDKAARITRLLFHSVVEIADREARPEWDEEGLAEVRALTGS